MASPNPAFRGGDVLLSCKINHSDGLEKNRQGGSAAIIWKLQYIILKVSMMTGPMAMLQPGMEYFL